MGDKRSNPVGRRNSDLVRLQMMWDIVDWDTSLAKATLTIGGQGAYRNILDKLYMACGKLLKQDHVFLAASGCRSMEEWRSLSDEVMQFFITTDDGKFVTHHRVTEQIKRVAGISKMRSAQGTKGNKVRWSKQLQTESVDRKSDPSAIAEAIANASPITNTITNTNTNIKPKIKSFVRPILEEVLAYCLERKNSVDAEAFIAHYEARGWKYNGGVSMKSWHAAIVTWEKNGNGRQRETTQRKPQPSTQHARWANNRKAVELAFGAAVGGTAADDGAGQAPRSRPAHGLVLEGEIKKFP